MRYRLRTLMIFVTCVGILLGWIAYLRRMADFHRREADRIIVSLATAENLPRKRVEENVAFLLAGGSAPQIGYRFGPGPPVPIINTRRQGFDAATIDTAADWKSACDHRILANWYDRAVIRPWELSWKPVP